MTSIQLAGAWFIAGFIAGVGFVLAIWWRPAALLRRQGAEIRRLRLALEDSTAKEAGQFQSAEKMARMLVEEKARGMRP